MKREAIALLITLIFIIAISASMAIGLRQVNDASHELAGQNFMLQTRVVLNDLLIILQNSKELEGAIKDNSIDGLHIFLLETATVAVGLEDLHANMEIKSARGKFNINNLMDGNSTINLPRVEIFKEYVSRYNVNSNFVEILLDNMGKIKEDASYNSAIFNENPTLQRDYIASPKHFEKITSYYEESYHDESLKKINFDALLIFSPSRGSIIDLNYATPQVWKILLGVDDSKAKALVSGGGGYKTLEDLKLNELQKARLSKFNTSFFEPFLDVKIEIKNEKQSAMIRFEYDMRTKKGSNYVYEL